MNDGERTMNINVTFMLNFVATVSNSRKNNDLTIKNEK